MLNSALTHENFATIPELVAKAEEWGTQISFSAYSALRTGDKSLCITTPEDLALLRRHLDWAKEHKRRTNTIVNSDYVLDKTYQFFAEGGMDGCQAGRRFLVVRPDGLINACSMFPDLQYKTRKEMVEGFKATRESCDECYVAIRAGTERSLWRLVQDNLGLVSRTPSFAKAGSSAGGAAGLALPRHRSRRASVRVGAGGSSGLPTSACVASV